MNSTRKEFLKELKQIGLERKIPNISEENAKTLTFFLRLKKAKRVLEIGTANGYSTIWLADAVEEFGGEVMSIEIAEHSYLEAQENIKKAGLSNVQLILGDAKEVLSTFECSFDVVFLDARKGHYHVFWELIKPLLHKDSLVLVDDVIKFAEKTKPFSEQMLQETEFEHIIIPVDGDDGVMLIQRV